MRDFKRAQRILVALAIVGAAGCGDENRVIPPEADAPPSGAQCSDGVDNDGDGLTDYPSDPGCAAPQQEDEVDDCPSGSHCPQCGNGIDDDGNGSIDYPNDTGCTSAADPIEFANNPVACGQGLVIKPLPSTGSDFGTLTAASTSAITSTCSAGGGVAAYAYQISLTGPKVLVASTEGSAIDTVLDLRGTNCTATEIDCHDDVSASDKTSTISRALPAGNYYLIVAAKDLGAGGEYQIDVRLLTGEGEACTATSQCGPGFVCRTPLGGTGMQCEKPVCSDGMDDDGDGKVDYPSDPGCIAADDSNEMDDCPNGASCPACSNGIDDDDDGDLDYPTDTSCTTASDTSEACHGEQDPVSAIVGPTTTGTLIGAHDNHDPLCGNNGGGDVIHTLQLPAMRSLVLDTEGSMADTLLSLLTASCTEPSLACDDQGGTSVGASRLALTDVTAGSYIVAVDNYSNTFPAGTYNLHVTGVIQPGGSCAPSDTLGGALACPTTNPCGLIAGQLRCLPSACGDGLDNDNDGKTDYPAEPGCNSPDDTDEVDTCPGVGCPDCSDGLDNDNDGATDFPLDTTCAAASSSEGCVSTENVTALVMPTTNDTTIGATNDVKPVCAAFSTHAAPDKTYLVQIPAMKSLSIAKTSPTGNWDAIVALYNSTCGGTAISCMNTPETVSLVNVAAGNYFFVVDGYSTASGAYTLTVTGTIQNGASCELPLAQNGAITCGDGFMCGGPTGARTCRLAACNDGVDNDGDGVGDYPNDPGCATSSDTDEADTCPGGVGCPACSDGNDNDGDLLIDFPDDPSCRAASGNSESCLTSEGVTPLVLPLTADTTIGAIHDEAPPTTCTASVNTAPDKVYSLSIPMLLTSLSITNTNSFDAIVSLYDSTCGGAPLSCMNEPENLTFGAMLPGTYYYSVDGNSSSLGAYTIGVTGKITPLQSCEGALAQSGALTCTQGYACQGTTGSRTCQVAACADGVDSDGDTLADYPLDPGCDSMSDNDEADPATPPTCSNGLDDDSDQTMDYPGDYGCSSASGASEAFCAVEVDATSLITTTPITGTTVGKANNFTTASCNSNPSGADVAYGLQLPVPVATLVIDLSNSAYNTVLTLRNTQCTAEIGCDDDSGDPTAQSKLTLTNVAAGGYAVIIDGFNGLSGAYSLAVTGTVAAGTSCSSPLFGAGVLVCPSGTTCTGTPEICQ